MATSTRILLVRHGESIAQAEGFVPGHDSCSGLTDVGRAQATALRDRLTGAGEIDEIGAVYASMLRRAIETAEVIAPALGGITVQTECAWCELHPGSAEGKRWEDLESRFPDGTPVDDPYVRLLPGMETWAEVYARVGARLLEIEAVHRGGSVIIVGHGGTVAASFAALGGLATGQALSLARTVVNTSITEWRTGRAGWRLMRYNDAAHLTAMR